MVGQGAKGVTGNIKMKHLGNMAMEEQDVKNAVIARLKELAVSYTLLEHQPIMTMTEGEAVARKLGIEACKNLLLVNRQGGLYLLLLDGGKKLDAKAVARQAGSSRLSFASADDMRESLAVQPGAVSILALMFDKDKRVRLLVDKDVAGREYIGCHPCVNTCSLRLRTKDVFETFLPAAGHEEYLTIEV